MTAVFSGVFAASAAETSAEDDPAAFSRLFFGLQPPSDRDAERRVELVEELVENGRVGEAAPLVQGLLEAPSDSVTSDGVSLRTRLTRILAESGPQSAGVLRTVLAGSAARELARAQSAAELREVIAKHPPVLFGHASLVRLAQAEADRGAYAAALQAAGLARELATRDGDTRTAAELWTLEASCRWRLGLPVRGIGFGGEPHDLTDIVESTASASRTVAQRRSPQSWLGPGGDARRLATAPGPAPGPWRAWMADCVADDETADSTDEGADSWPALRHATVAVGGVVVTTTPSGLAAFGASSGKRLWEVKLHGDEVPFAAQAYGPTPQGLATDTERLFALSASVSPAGADDLLAGRDPDLIFRGEPPAPPANALSAYEIASGGKLLWRCDGGQADGPLSGARFLGPPAVAESLLYLLAEIDQVVCLVEIEASTGRLGWVQPIVQCERELDPREGLIEVTPTIEGGTVYCPTGRGAVAAIDPIRRRIVWLSYLRVDPSQAAPSPQRGWGAVGGRISSRWSGDGVGWRVCHALMAEGKLLVASPAAPSLQAFDAETGDVVWRHDDESAVLLAGVIDDTAVVVGDEGFTGRRLADGEKLWSVALPEGAAACGEAILLSKTCLLPLTTGRFAKVDLSSAEPTLSVVSLDLNPLAPAPKLGGLVYHDGAVISRSTTTLEVYRQRDGLGEPARRAIDSLATGHYAEAVEGLERAVSAAPGDRRLEERLAAALLGLARERPEDAKAIGERLATLAPGPSGATITASLRLHAASSQRDRNGVLDEAAVIARAGAGDSVLSPESQLDVRARWLVVEAIRQFNVAADEAIEQLTNRGVRRSAAQRWFTPLRESAATPRPHEAPSAGDGLNWSHHQVIATVEDDPSAEPQGRTARSRLRERVRRVRPLPVTIGDPVENAPVWWSIETDGRSDTRLVGLNPRGERVFAHELPSDSPPATRGDTPGGPSELGWRDWLVVRLDNGFAVCRVGSSVEVEGLPPEESPTGFAWSSAGAPAHGWPLRDRTHGVAESPVAIGPWGVVSVSPGVMRCRDLASGVLHWTRRFEDLAAETPWVLAVGDDLFVAGGTTKARLSAWSGQVRSEADALPPPKSWRACEGRGLLAELRAAGQRRFWISELGEDEVRPVWEATFPTSTRYCQLDELAIFLSEDLRLTAVDIASARPRFDVHLPGPAEPPVRALRVHRFHDRILVEIDRSNPMVDRMRGAASLGESPLLTGELHCLDPATGKSLWPRPAEIDGLGLVDQAATDTPVLLLARRRAVEAGGESTDERLAIVAIDLASGGSVFSDYNLPAGDAASGTAPVRTLLEQRPGGQTLVIHTGRSWVTLRVTGEPAAPRTPMLARVEDPDAARPNGAKDIERGVERLLKSFWDGDDD